MNPYQNTQLIKTCFFVIELVTRVKVHSRVLQQCTCHHYVKVAKWQDGKGQLQSNGRVTGREDQTSWRETNVLSEELMSKC